MIFKFFKFIFKNKKNKFKAYLYTIYEILIYYQLWIDLL